MSGSRTTPPPTRAAEAPRRRSLVSAATRRQPVRTCLGCRTTAGKAELIRLVTTPEGVRIDRDGKAPGRGAYLHPRGSCCDAALRRGALARALRTALSPEEASTLRADIEGASIT